MVFTNNVVRVRYSCGVRGLQNEVLFAVEGQHLGEGESVARGEDFHISAGRGIL